MNPATSDWMEVAFRSLTHATWQGAELALVVLVATCCLGERLQARWRFGLWLLVFARLATPWIPAAPWSLYVCVPSLAEPKAAADSVRTTPLADMSPEKDRPQGTGEFESVERANRPRVAGASRPAERQTRFQDHAANEHADWHSRVSLPQWLVLGWMAGVLLLAGRMTWLQFRLSRVRAMWTTPSDPVLGRLFQDCRREAGVSGPVALQLAPGDVGPATCGVRTPVIVLPARLATLLVPDELRMVLLHELIHVRRRDAFVDLVASGIACLHWFNPAAWLALAGLRCERELACDAALLERLGTHARRDYGSVLLKVVESLHPPATLAGAVAMFAGRFFSDSLERRIQMIAHHRQMTRAARAAGCALLIALALLGLTDAAPPPVRIPATDRTTKAAGAQSTDAGELPATARQEKPPPPARTMTIAGTCEDDSGQPLADASVVLYRVNRGQAARELQKVRTDRAGHYRFPRLESLPAEDGAAAHYSVVATSPGRASQIREYITRELPLVATFTMPPAATLSGRVTDPEGMPVSGAFVWSRAPADRPLEGVLSAITGTDGRFEITDLAPFDGAADAGKKLPNGAPSGLSSVFFTVRHPDFAEQRPKCALIPDAFEIKLSYAGAIEGRVVDAVTGNPAPGVLVSMQGTHLDKNGSWHETLTDSEGKYRFPGLAPVPLNVWATAADRACAALDSVQVVAKETKKLPDLRLVEGGWIEGRVVTTDNRPVRIDPGTRRRLRIGLHGPSRPNSGAAVESCVVDDEGRFRIRVPAGSNRPYVMSQAFRERTFDQAQLATDVNIRDGETVNVSFRVVDIEPTKDADPEGARKLVE